jgi:putative ABC transport system permease protein
MALGVALVVVILVIHGVISRSFGEAAQGYHLIVGARGGSLQLVLNTVFHLSKPIENLPYDFYKQFVEYEDEQGNKVSGKYAAIVRVAVPYCLGDSYKGFRAVGTTPDLFDKISYGSYDDGTPKKYEFAEGENFKPEDFMGAVVGATAARETGLRIGDRFPITHGLAEDENAHVHEESLFHVVGILRPTGTPNDRAVFVNMEGFYLMEGHALEVDFEDDGAEATQKTSTGVEKEGAGSQQPQDHGNHGAENEQGKGDHAEHDHTEHDHAEHGPSVHKGHGGLVPLPEEEREVTAILLLLENDAYSLGLAKRINKGRIGQAVFPAREVATLFEGLVGHVRVILLVFAVLVVVVAGIGVLVSIYNSMSDRSREIAVMRALGARRSTVMLVVLLESILLSLLGGIGGVLLGHGAIAALSPIIVQWTGVSIHAFQFEFAELIIIPALVALAALVGYLPALTAYRTDVDKALSAAP